MTKSRDTADINSGTNTAVGEDALESNTASSNTAVGYGALTRNTSGTRNVGIGHTSLNFNTTASYNTALGFRGLFSNTTGASNVGLGYQALDTNTSGSNNVAIGRDALVLNTTASYNTAVGYQSGYSNTTGTQQTFIGYQAGQLNTTGNDNTFIGRRAGYSTTTGSDNAIVGDGAGSSHTTGSGNGFFGTGAGNAVTSGSKHTIIGRYNGNQGGLDIRTSSNNIVLSDGDGNPRGYYHGGLGSPLWVFKTPSTNQNSMHIDSTSSSSPYGPAIRFTADDPNNTSNYFLSCQANGTSRFIVYSNGNAQNTNNSYTGISDVKLKENIVDSGSQWDDIKALRVRKYSLKEQNSTEPTQIGVIAQEVEAAGMSGLVTESPDRDAENNDLGTVTKAVQYSVLYMKAVKALQEAMTRIETLETKVTALEG